MVDHGSDEVGQLARTFERMRLRLANLDRARGEFIANASHELRTPLFSLGGFLELLDDPDLDEATRDEFVGQMREQVARLTKLATNLLDLSRLDAGRLTVAREPLDLSELAGELVAEFGPRAAAAGASPRAPPAEPGVAAQGDGERVLQIGRVLVENALVHTPAGTTVRVSTAVDGGRATLTVANDGPAIPAEAQERIFERFYRLDGGRASGSGLGLAIARELAEVMGGRIELDSRDGWTLFTLVLSADVPEREPGRASSSRRRKRLIIPRENAQTLCWSQIRARRRRHGYSGPPVRSSSAAALALVAAVIGGAAVLVVGKAAGWLGGSDHEDGRRHAARLARRRRCARRGGEAAHRERLRARADLPLALGRSRDDRLVLQLRQRPRRERRPGLRASSSARRA